MSLSRIDLFALIVFLSVAFFMTAGAQDANLEMGILDPGFAEQGSPAPDFRLKDLDMNLVQLSQYRGTPVILNFFASWCGPCIIEMPYIQAAHEQATDNGYVVLGVAVEDSRGAIEDMMASENFTYLVVIDGDSSVKLTYQVVGPPYTFFIDRTGTIQTVVSGPLEQEELDLQLAQLLDTE
jgi:peroxiredoxin